MQQVPDGLEKLLAGCIGEIQIVVQIMMRNGAVELHEPFRNVHNLYFIQSLKLLLDYLVDLLVLLAQGIRLMASGQQRRNNNEAFGVSLSYLSHAFTDAFGDFFGRIRRAIIGATL